jgi:hypothetical protein
MNKNLQSRFDERLALMDGIVGRCLRESDFGRQVLEDPETALKGYALSEEEMNDFRALAKHRDSVLRTWAELRAIFWGGEW